MDNRLCTKLADAYLVYVNDYLTVEKFAADNGMTKEQALTALSLGRVMHENRVELFKLEKQDG